ncbi:MAG: 2-dehydropantoate 2-reductase [Vicinamibacteria bacterium]
MRFAVVGSGAVGGYYGAKLQRAGHDVTLIARGLNLAALRERGLNIESAALGDFHVKPRAEETAAEVHETEVVLLATKTYDNDTAIPLVKQLLDQGTPDAYVLTLQNGVSSPYALATAVGESRVMAGPTYVATALVEPGRIVHTGVHRRIAFGEVFNIGKGVSARAQALHEVFVGADIVSEPHRDGRNPLWQKYAYLGPFAAFTGAARLPIGPLWADPGTRQSFLAASGEMHALAKAEGVSLAVDSIAQLEIYIGSLQPDTRSSLLIDLQQGKKIEVEGLLGFAVRLGEKQGVATPILKALYSVLKPWANGPR